MLQRNAAGVMQALAVLRPAWWWCLVVVLAIGWRLNQGIGHNALAEPVAASAPDTPRVEIRVAGWRVRISPQLMLAQQRAATERALELLAAQLEEIVRVVPADAVAKLRTVPLYVSPPYEGFTAKAEYHPSAAWLREHGRDPAMAKAVEFTNVHIFEAETRRMPNFALHELAHAYHDRELAEGFRNPDVIAAFERARAAGIYEHVERHDAEGRRTTARHYALVNPQEYFAEATEAYFSRNDFFPFCRAEIERHDPPACEMLRRLWGSAPDAAP